MGSSRARLRRSKELAGEIEVVSRERVRDELTRMLTEGHASRAFLLLDETGLLKQGASGNFGDARSRATAGISS